MVNSFQWGRLMLRRPWKGGDSKRKTSSLDQKRGSQLGLT